MKLFSQTKRTMQDVSAASQQVTETSEAMRVALLIAAGFALGAALLYAVAVLSEVRQ